MIVWSCMSSDYCSKLLPGFTEWCWAKYDGVQNIYSELEERIKIHSWQSSCRWKWSAAWTNWFEVFYMKSQSEKSVFSCLLQFHLIMVCHQHIVKLLPVPLSRSTGKQIQSLIGSIYKAESTAAGINYVFRFIWFIVFNYMSLGYLARYF